MESLDDIFLNAREMGDATERAAYLAQTCGADAALRGRVEALLRDADDAADFFGAEDNLPGMVATPLTEGPGTVIGRYKLLEKIGEGGMGVVYMAEQREPVVRKVALKIIKLGMDTRQVLGRFEAERQALALMDHPNIAKILDGGATETGRPYFVMDLVQGLPITRFCDEANLSTRERLDLFLDVCSAIQHAHQKGIIHRDIKPANILVTLHGDKPVPKVIDFGVAKATQGRLTEKTLFTQFQHFIGTPAYMSPEQTSLSGLDIDTRSDIYGLGVLLYELLTGKTPFDAKELLASGIDAMRKTIREQEPVRPSTVVERLSKLRVERGEARAPQGRSTLNSQLKSLSTDLDWIVMKCLEKDRSRRYETANGLAADLKRHLSNEPVIARPPSQLYRFQKLARRNRLAFAAIAAITAVLLLGVVVSSWQAVRATRAEKEQSRLRESEAKQRQHAEARELDARHRAYASDMNLVQRALELNNLDSALSLLNRYKPVQKSEIQDLRGWEWRYLWNQCQSDAQCVFCQRSNPITALAVSHDGKWLAVGENNQGVSVWDLATRQEIISLPAGGGVVRAAFSPRELLLAYSMATGSGSTNRQDSIRLWNGATRQIVTNLSIGGVCLDLAFSDDGGTLVASTQDPDNQVTLWRVGDGTRLAQYATPQIGPVGAFAVAADLSVVAHATGDDNTGDDKVRVIDLATGKQRWKAKATDDFVMALALSPDGKMLASGPGFADSVIRLWDVASGIDLGRLEGHRAGVHRLVFWPDGRTLASASFDQTIRLWDVSDPAQGRSLSTLRGHKAAVVALTLLPDNTTLVSGSEDESVCLWDTGAARRERKYVTLPAQLEEWRFAPDSKSVVTVDIQGHVARWQGRDFEEMKLLLEIGNFDEVRLSEDCRWLAVASVDYGIRVWDLHTRARVGVFTPPAGLDPSTGREYTHSRTRIGGFTGNPGPVVLRQFLAQGSKLMIAHRNDNSLHEWDLNTWQETRSWPGAPGLSTHAFSHDEHWCLTSTVHPSTGSTSSLIDLTTGHLTALNLGWYADASFSPDGKLFAVASWWGVDARLRETDTRREVATFRGFLMGVKSVAFSPDGTRLATGSAGREAIKLWDVESHQELLTLEGQGSWFNSAAFSPDGTMLGCNTFRGRLHLWRAPSWEEIEAAEQAQTK